MNECTFCSVNEVTASQIWIKIYMTSPSPFLECVRSRTSRVLEVTILSPATQTEFEIWAFGVHCLLADKVNKACKGPGNLRVFSPGEVQTKEKCNGGHANMPINV